MCHVGLVLLRFLFFQRQDIILHLNLCLRVAFGTDNSPRRLWCHHLFVFSLRALVSRLFDFNFECSDWNDLGLLGSFSF